MESLTIKAHFNGTQIILDEPAELEKNSKLLVVVLPNGRDTESEEWFGFAAAHFNSAFSDDEPEYRFEDLIEVNPAYDGR